MNVEAKELLFIAKIVEAQISNNLFMGKHIYNYNQINWNKKKK